MRIYFFFFIFGGVRESGGNWEALNFPYMQFFNDWFKNVFCLKFSSFYWISLNVIWNSFGCSYYSLTETHNGMEHEKSFKFFLLARLSNESKLREDLLFFFDEND
jgi:hypothetical protein